MFVMGSDVMTSSVKFRFGLGLRFEELDVFDTSDRQRHELSEPCRRCWYVTFTQSCKQKLQREFARHRWSEV